MSSLLPAPLTPGLLNGTLISTLQVVGTPLSCLLRDRGAAAVTVCHRVSLSEWFEDQEQVGPHSVGLCYSFMAIFFFWPVCKRVQAALLVALGTAMSSRC